MQKQIQINKHNNRNVETIYPAVSSMIIEHFGPYSLNLGFFMRIIIWWLYGWLVQQQG